MPAGRRGCQALAGDQTDAEADLQQKPATSGTRIPDPAEAAHPGPARYNHRADLTRADAQY